MKFFIIIFVTVILGFCCSVYATTNVCDDVPNLGLVADPDDCTKFFICMAGNPISSQCPSVTPVFYNGSCVAGYPETCLPATSTTIEPPITEPVPTTTEPDSSTTEDTTIMDDTTKTEDTETDTTPDIITEPTTTLATDLPDDFCEGIVNDLLPYPGYCSRFVHCLNENPTVNSCPDQTIFQNKGCVAGNSTTCLTDNFCDGIDFKIFAHPTNCFQFVTCMNENPTIYSCPPESPVFDDGSCYPGDPSTCEVNLSLTTIPTTEDLITTTEPATTEPITTSSTTPIITTATEPIPITTEQITTTTSTTLPGTTTTRRITTRPTSTVPLPTPPQTVFTRTSTSTTPRTE